MVVVEVRVGLKRGVTDPEGSNTKKSLELLGYDEVLSVKSVKVYHMELETIDPKKARERVEEMCKRLLTNPAVHTYEIIFP
ncbi:MAG: phosphoribosylformylglycinamidine synthase subunit PurS [Candidatus Thermoplasmatota archaeon]|jgi:phosphoribosylformylglycinamidine synthase|nr:phosphoribosylformylglycinamidine synthase subunit PurS [Candidatus Thermoplasmatota archaeon]